MRLQKRARSSRSTRAARSARVELRGTSDRAARREQQQLAAAIAYERDPERRRVAADLQRASYDLGGALRRLANE